MFQERALAEQLPLWRNIFMGRPLTRRFGFLRTGEMRQITSDLMGRSMGFTSAVLTPDTTVTGLSGGERQGLAIVRALHFEAEIIILDEPTMGLSLKETEKLLTFVDGIRAAGKSAIFIDHNIFHVYSVADRIIVLDRGTRGGRVPDLALLARGADGDHARGRGSRRLHGGRALPSRGDAAVARRHSAGRARFAGMNEVATPAAMPARPRLASWTAAWASQIGITTAFVILWLTFIVLAPGTFLSENIYLSFAQTTPYFALVAMPLTMVIIAGDIDLSFPSIMALGMVGFVFVWQATGSVALGAAASLGVGALAGLFNGLVVTFVGIPSLVVTIGTQFLFRGLTLVLVNGRSYALVDTKESPAYDCSSAGCSASRWSSGGWSSSRSAPGSSSTATASARTRTWSATTARRRR